MTNNKEKKSLDFYGLGIAPKFLEILKKLNFTVPTPIQLKSIPVAIEGKDIVGIAQTGTGKTLAFGIPMIQRLAQNKGKGLILLPTRELAFQVEEHLKMIGGKLGLKTAVLVGGEPINKQFKKLRNQPHVIIATPGRLIDHLKRSSIKLGSINILILDEADLMFDMGFAPQIEEILKTVPKKRQTMLFSATMDPKVMKIAAKHMALPIRIEVAPSGTVAEKVIHEMIIIKKEEKLPQLEKILKEYSGSVLIFVRTKHGVKNLNKKIKQLGHSSAEIHSNRSLGQRREALSSFKNGRIRVLVATDIAARGIDVKGIELVLNYDLPDNLQDYVHRIGRTGRAGKAGRAVSFAQPNQINDIKKIEQIIKQNIPLTQLAKIKFGNKGFKPRRNKFSSPYSANKSKSGGQPKFGGNGQRKKFMNDKPKNEERKFNRNRDNNRFKDSDSNNKKFKNRRRKFKNNKNDNQSDEDNNRSRKNKQNFGKFRGKKRYQFKIEII